MPNIYMDFPTPYGGPKMFNMTLYVVKAYNASFEGYFTKDSTADLDDAKPEHPRTFWGELKKSPK